MREEMTWDKIYELWRYEQYMFADMATAPLSAEEVYVEYNKDGYIYGYDWLEKRKAFDRKNLISERPMEFLYFTRPSNKGTIHTAEMLIEAETDEERAAIWIAATAKELRDYQGIHTITRYADEAYYAACKFLEKRFYTWHHAMRKLVPEIMIPYSVLDSLSCKSMEPVIGLIQMNTILIKSSYTILRYTSLKDGELPEHHSSNSGMVEYVGEAVRTIADNRKETLRIVK